MPAYLHGKLVAIANSLLFSSGINFPGATFPSGIKIDGR